jgi:hypothetical protein
VFSDAPRETSFPSLIGRIDCRLTWLFLQALVKVPSNARACVAVGGVELAVDLLASAHEAAERAVTPSQNNLIAASAHVDPPKEWYYQGKGDATESDVSCFFLKFWGTSSHVQWQKPSKEGRLTPSLYGL